MIAKPSATPTAAPAADRSTSLTVPLPSIQPIGGKRRSAFPSKAGQSDGSVQLAIVDHLRVQGELS